MYDDKSCNALEKPFYSPIEAALRWCNLIACEAEIMGALAGEATPPATAFPQWPCLRANAEKILYAMLNGELAYGRDGKSVEDGDQVAKHRMTATHADLKAWMEKYYPSQKPAFLFDEIERTTHNKITIESWQALQAERDSLKVRVEKAEALYRERWSKLEAEAKDWREKYELAIADTKPSHLLTIAALLELQTAPVAHARPSRKQDAIKTTIMEEYNLRGLSKRTLDDIFADANRAMREAKQAR